MHRNSDSSTNIINITRDYSIDYEPIDKNAFAEFIREKREEYSFNSFRHLRTIPLLQPVSSIISTML